MKKSTLLFTISFLLLLFAIFLAYRYTAMVQRTGVGADYSISRTTKIASWSPGAM